MKIPNAPSIISKGNKTIFTMLINDWIKEYFTVLKPIKTLNCRVKMEKNIVNRINIAPNGIFSFNTTRSGAQIFKPAKNSIDSSNVTIIISVNEVFIRFFLFFSGKYRITLISNPKSENILIKLIAEIIAELIPISSGEYSLAAIIQKINPTAAVINVFPIK